MKQVICTSIEVPFVFAEHEEEWYLVNVFEIKQTVKANGAQPANLRELYFERKDAVTK